MLSPLSRRYGDNLRVLRLMLQILFATTDAVLPSHSTVSCVKSYELCCYIKIL
jgi:hypothetical protein